MKKKTNPGPKKQKTPKYNNISCPKGMTIENWQTALRKQAAEREHLAVIGPADTDSNFEVRNPKTTRRYDVSYYGPGSQWNRCSCMDFKTSGLGTCKHIEAISLAHEGRFARKNYPQPESSSVNVDYRGGRRIRIRLGKNSFNEMKTLSRSLFDSEGYLKEYDIDPSPFIRKAKEFDPGFMWGKDAIDMVVEIRDRNLRKRIIGKKEYSGGNLDGLLKTRLHPYQADGVRFAFTAGKSINADEMGLGKTIQAIATAELLRKEGLISSVVVICPTSLKYQWLSEIKRFTESSAVVVEGDLLKRAKALAADGFFKIVSYHGIANNIKAGYVPETDMVIIDEVQRLKNWETKMGIQLRKLNSPYVLALSGTPLENKLKELYSVMEMVDQFALGPYYKFTTETTLTDETGRVVGYKNLHMVAQMLESVLIRRRKKDVKLQMPTRTDTNLFVPMTKEQAAMHADFQFHVSILINKWHKYRFLSETDRTRLLLLLSKMRMVCDSTFILDQETRFDTKIDEAMAIIRNLTEQADGKVVIFSQWERMLRILSQELESEGISFSFLHGGVPSHKRKDLMDRFTNDAECRVFLSTDAGCTGLNLQAASLLINLDLPWNPAVLEQRIARIFRLGQENPVQIINMIAKDTIEERMLSTLNFKSNLSAGILDNGDDAVFLDNKNFSKIVEVMEDVVDSDASSEEGHTEDTHEGIAEILPEATAETSPSEKTMEEDSLSVETGKEGTTPDIPEEKTSIKENPTKNANEKPATKDEATRDGQSSNGKSSIRNGRQTSNSNHSENENPGASQSTSATPGRQDFGKIMSEGISAISKIATALKDPASARQIAEALTSENPETGQITLNIPVPDKETVVNLFSALSAFLNKPN